MPTCAACHVWSPDSAQFCHSCGNAVAFQPEVVGSGNAQSTAAPELQKDTTTTRTVLPSLAAAYWGEFIGGSIAVAIGLSIAMERAKEPMLWLVLAGIWSLWAWGRVWNAGSRSSSKLWSGLAKFHVTVATAFGLLMLLAIFKEEQRTDSPGSTLAAMGAPAAQAPATAAQPEVSASSESIFMRDWEQFRAKHEKFFRSEKNFETFVAALEELDGTNPGMTNSLLMKDALTLANAQLEARNEQGRRRRARAAEKPIKRHVAPNEYRIDAQPAARTMCPRGSRQIGGQCCTGGWIDQGGGSATMIPSVCEPL